MIELLRSPSRSASGAIFYVTIGTLLIIWAGLWYFYFLMRNPEAPAWQSFACVGTILSGAAIVAIGLLFGLIGQGAKAADNTVGVASPDQGVAVVQTGDAIAAAPVAAAPVAVATVPTATAPITTANR